ncbi:SURF1 family protein [Kordiimonas marina]|uniref:SURF1 family protein n=1 Tax=Kordiimonas marina TaxID=2872312 RepID=UPI001FF3DA20|nr:SURF1 family cytochrome oxidase biogenesis protein [Kordiimonas marina]MCJ9427638.1 hypothetical protein [Kordiimonas marina]
MSKRFAPGTSATVTALIGLAILFSLGTWQALKVGPKTELITRIKAGMSEAPMELTVHIDDPSVLEYRHVGFEGTVMKTAPVKVFGTNTMGEAGYHLYIPVTMRFGRAVFVDFGWVPAAIKTPPSLHQGEMITVTGILRQSAKAGWMTPDNVPDKGEWFTADIYQMAKHYGLGSKDFYHFRVIADKGVLAGNLPVGGQVRVDIPNNHFQYALTWFGLAAALILIYVSFGFSEGREDKPGA